jgi:acetyl esterase/lipase
MFHSQLNNKSSIRIANKRKEEFYTVFAETQSLML